MNIDVTKMDGLWISGTIGDARFSAKVYDLGSDYGINGGRVSKLWIRGVASYDRGWDQKARSASDLKMVNELVGFLEEAPKLQDR